MERLIEGTIGEAAGVWVQDRGGGGLRLRGSVVIEDLTPVLTSIASRSGANGPMNPVTQYILSAAADHLASRLTDGLASGDREAVPRILSGSLGHQPFIEQVLGMSQHQMLRRWPLASDWYTDVINYIMRPGRFDDLHRQGIERLDEWTSGTLGEFVRRMGAHVVQGTQPEHIGRVSEALQQLWPDYPPVRNAVNAYARQVRELWIPLWVEAARRYGLVVRSDVDIEDLAWSFNALQARETIERLGSPEPGRPLVPGGEPWTRTSRGVLLLLSGVLTDKDGRVLTLQEIIGRRPEAAS